MIWVVRLVLVRHGESEWNKKNLFTGWTDVDLSDNGEKEARQAGKIIRKAGLTFDIAYTSVLRRAVRTLWLILEEMNLCWIPEVKSWRLNERHYGALQGLNKAETMAEYGEDQVKIWRRSYAAEPPPVLEEDERFPGHDSRYANVNPADLPRTESLKKTGERLLPFWESDILPFIRKGKNVLIVAHGNSLRALVKHLDQLSESQVLELNIPTGKPLVYELDQDGRPVRHEFLA